MKERERKVRRERGRDVRQPDGADRALQEEPDGGHVRERDPPEPPLQRHQGQRGQDRRQGGRAPEGDRGQHLRGREGNSNKSSHLCY